MKREYLILFKFGDNKYAIETSLVREIILIEYLQRVPGCYEHIAGITIHRGTLIPLYNIGGIELIGRKDNFYAIIIYAKEKYAGFICEEPNVCYKERAKIIEEKDVKINYNRKIIDSLLEVNEEIYGLIDYEKLKNYYIENKGGLNESENINSR